MFTRSLFTVAVFAAGMFSLWAAPGDWPMWRQNSFLTGVQSIPGEMKEAPRVVAEYFLGTSHGVRVVADLRNSGKSNEVIVVERARVFAYDAKGKRLWESAPEGYVPEKIEWVLDLDGDGSNEVIAVAGHMGLTRQAYLILDGKTGAKRGAIDINTGDFSWRGHCGAYLPGAKGKQIFIITSCRQSEHGAFPAALNGEASLWSFDGGKTQRHWAWTPSEYVLFYPSVMVGDLNNDGRFHAVIDSWSHVWQIDLATGAALSHTTWDPQGANQRQYGWNEIVDVDGDAKLDFVNISLTKHVDVLRNVNGKLQLGWTKGWPDPVTTEVHAIHGPADPVVDLDGDGKKELIASFFEGMTNKRWKLWIWDAATGEQKFEMPDLVALASVPLASRDEKDGRMLFCARSSKVGYEPAEAYEVWKLHRGELKKVWTSTNAAFITQTVESNDRRAVYFSAINVKSVRLQDVDGDGRMEFFTKAPGTSDSEPQAWGFNKEGIIVSKKGKLSDPQPTYAKKIPSLQGTTVPYLLAADLDGKGRNEILLYDNSNITVLQFEKKKLRQVEKIPSTEIPVVCDLLGDGRPALLTAGRQADGNLWIKARGADGRALWEFTFPNSAGCGQYSERPHYILAGHFSGGKHFDIFAYSTKPSARSYVLDGRSGKIIWERVDIASVERFFQPLGGRASAWDYNGDGAEDVLMCIPDFYVVADGRKGDPLVGPMNIQPLLNWWAAYGSPAPLRSGTNQPIVYLGGVYSSRGSISLDGQRGLWREYLPTERWPLRAGNSGFNEGLLPPTNKRGWRAAQMEADGTIVCFDVETGKHAWKMMIPTGTSGMISGDVDGDGPAELLFGGQDGFLYAIRDAGERGEILWRKQFAGPVQTPLMADVDNDGKSEIVVSVGDGLVYVLDR